MPRKRDNSNVAFRFRTTVIEDLPLPIVHFPGPGGAFFGFQGDSEFSCFLCSCSRLSVESYIELRLAFPQRNAYADRQYLISSFSFPLEIVKDLMERKISETSEIINNLKFQDDLCHMCNKKTPSLYYCIPMYGCSFKQKYGWYINQQGLKHGIMNLATGWLPHRCPEYILDEITLDSVAILNQAQKLVDQKEFIKAEEVRKPLRKQDRRIWSIIENEVREAFGFNKVGEAWVTETLLFNLVSELFPQYNVVHHLRPKFLDGLELDIFIEQMNTGVEYQGVQHYKAVKHWGGKKALEKTKERDTRKKRLCKANGINLVFFKHSEEISKELVSKKLLHLAEDNLLPEA